MALALGRLRDTLGERRLLPQGAATGGRAHACACRRTDRFDVVINGRYQRRDNGGIAADAASDAACAAPCAFDCRAHVVDGAPGAATADHVAAIRGSGGEQQ